ncbi:hypothetical protein, partial [Rhizobium anhuiense]
GHGKFLSLKGTQSSGNSLCLPRTSDNHTNLTARTLPRSGFVREAQSGHECRERQTAAESHQQSLVPLMTEYQKVPAAPGNPSRRRTLRLSADFP